ncbi:MAG TPA: hypothetical protein VFP66_03015 [Candidatus Limnocylindrales bacterium]|nr:hypothetical protein [Candidatus Limnocylindrales bacterium]
MKRNWLEWAILVVSVAVVVALVGYLLVSGFVTGGPAMIRLEVTAAEVADGQDDGWLVPLTVRNEGGKAAVSIVVEGTAIVAGAEESSELTVDLLAAGSEVELVLGFSAQPEGEVKVRVVGFETP